MNIVEALLARLLTPQGQIEQYAAAAQKAVVKANKAISDIDTITEQTIANNEMAAAASEAAQGAVDTVTDLIGDVESIQETVDTEIKKIDLSKNDNSTDNYNSTAIILTYPDTTSDEVNNIVKNYKSTGQNTDGSMTQKAISAEISRLDARIDEESQGSGGSTDLGPENAGQMVIVGENGYIIPGDTTEAQIIQALISTGAYDAKDAVGLEVDYSNKSFTRAQQAIGKTPGDDFNPYLMYGGRTRCNVSDNGTITAWYGDNNFKDDGSNGQVMVYQPKFYYTVVPTVLENNYIGGKTIRKEIILISSTAQNGFKVHPLFINASGEEVDYVLLSAYEGSAYLTNSGVYDTNDSDSVDFNTDKLSSVGGAKPISGVNKQLTVEKAEQLAKNRGTGWHITNLAAESALQMLFSVEYGSLNCQNSLELGLVNLPNNSSYNCASLTGSTSSLGNVTGHATATIHEVNGSYTSYNENGKRAITYRGMENPWGNIWRMIGGINVVGNNNNNGGMCYICSNYNYSTESTNYKNIGFYLPATYDWISAFGNGNNELDWTFIPIECNNSNSALPVGDSIWTTANLNTTNMCMIGGAWSFNNYCGLFSYAFDKTINDYSRAYSARLMFVPEKGTIYNNNIQAWRTKMGVE